MSNCIDLILSSSSCDKAKLVCDRIHYLFDVEVKFLNVDSMTVDKDEERKRVRLKSIMNEKVNLEKSKDYLLSACGEDTTVREKIYSAEAYDRALSMRDDVERRTGVLLHYKPEKNMVLLTGQESCVEEASRLLDSVKQGCRLLESEDSSYDSDYDVTESEFRHDDVSRTISDTLAAEYADYVTDEERKVTDLQAILSDANYTSKVEFSLKLGYTEYQVQTALQKLGPQPSQNELLGELIKLGATAKSEDRGSDESSDGAGDIPIVELRSDDGSNLRHVVIDGSNVAISHGNKEWFSCRGIKLCVDWFRSRGHRDITVFVPRWRKEASRPDAPIKDQDILVQLEKERLLVFTPSRYVGGRRMVCYDDRYILKLAVQVDGIVVSNDNYRDLTNENPEYKKVVEERLLMYSFVNDRFMPPDDPLGRRGPSLDNFLRKQPKAPETLPPPCPYGKKCTYGNKCKYYHPERGNQPQKSITERLAEQAKIQLQEVKSRGLKSRDSSPGDKLKITQSLPLSSESSFLKVKKPLSRTKSVTSSTLSSEQLASEQLFTVHNLETAQKVGDDRAIMSTDQGDNPPTSLATHLLTNLSYHPSSGDIHSVEPLGAWSPLSIVSPTCEQTSCSSSWATISSTLPKNISGPRVELFLEPDRGGHLSVAKKLSDPENISNAARLAYSQVPSTSSGGTPPEDKAVNLHRKLQRQLTLNPVCDPRLHHLRGYATGTQRMVSTQPEHYNMPQPADHPLLMQRASSQENIHSHGSYTNYTYRHQQIARLGSDSRVALSIPSHLQPWDNAGSGEQEHHSVTRIASAPDSYRQWPPATSRMQRLNSTSDTRLNMFPDIHTPAHQIQLSCPQGSGFLSSYLGELPTHQWLLQTAESVPMTSTGLQIMGGSTPTQTTTNRWPEPVHGTGISLGQLTQPVRPSSVPPQGMQMATATIPPHPTPHAPSPDIPDDTRYRLYYHLSSIFPEEQVRAAMEMYPEETNPQKICAAILTLYPK